MLRIERILYIRVRIVDQSNARVGIRGDIGSVTVKGGGVGGGGGGGWGRFTLPWLELAVGEETDGTTIAGRLVVELGGVIGVGIEAAIDC